MVEKVSGQVPELMQKAKKQYSESLRLTNKALKSPADVKKDTTLLGIMILPIFETISGGSHLSLNAWKNLLNGAAALLQLRGREQLKRSGGRRMFMQVTTTLITSCVQYYTEVPAHIIELWAEATRYLTAARFYDCTVSFANLWARVKQNIIKDPTFIFGGALELDNAFELMFTDVPRELAYETVCTSEPSEVIFSGHHHVYQDSIVAQQWNAMRSFRLLLNEMIRYALQTDFNSPSPQLSLSEYLVQFQKSTHVMRQMRLDILASVPQHLGYTQKGKQSTDYKTSWSDFENGWIH